MIFRDKEEPKRKVNSDDECYNCHKLGHFGRDCFLLDRRLNRTTTLTQQSPKEKSRKEDLYKGRSGIRSGTSNREYQAAKNNKSLKYDEDFDPKPFPPRLVRNAFMVKERELQKLGTNNTSFPDSCTSRHMCNDWTLFSDLKAKSIDFVTAVGQVIWIEKIGTVTIPLANGNIELHNDVLARGCDSNLIWPSQLQETEITYHDNPTTMTLMQYRKVIDYTKRTWNLFPLDLAHLGRAMAVTIKPKAMAIAGQARAIAITGQGRPTHLVSQNKRIRLWQRRLAHVSNVYIVRAAKLIDTISLEQENK